MFIPRLNAWLRDLAAREGATFVDYYARLQDGAGALRPELAADGVHVTRAAYRTMLSELTRVLARPASHYSFRIREPSFIPPSG